MRNSPITSASELQIATDGPVVRWTLHRPDKRNALSRGLLQLLDDAIDAVANKPAARVVVLAASGSAFCSGHDLTEMVGLPEQAYRELFGLCTRVMLGLRRLPQPVIARVQGMATAAGCQLAAACDLVVAAEEARFATPGVNIGLFCTTPMVPLVRAIPAKPALEMLLTGHPISARRAYELGLVNRVVPADQLDAAVSELTSAIIASSAMTVRLGKTAFYDLLHLDEAGAYDRATCIMTENAVRPDAQEGMQAFLQKRPARWTEGE
jgi:enoyl-CoA hydratase/carnithine racemase